MVSYWQRPATARYAASGKDTIEQSSEAAVARRTAIQIVIASAAFYGRVSSAQATEAGYSVSSADKWSAASVQLEKTPVITANDECHNLATAPSFVISLSLLFVIGLSWFHMASSLSKKSYPPRPQGWFDHY